MLSPAVQDQGVDTLAPVVIAYHGQKRFDARSRFIEVELEVHGLDKVIGRTIIFEIDGLMLCLGIGHRVHLVSGNDDHNGFYGLRIHYIRRSR